VSLLRPLPAPDSAWCSPGLLPLGATSDIRQPRRRSRVWTFGFSYYFGVPDLRTRHLLRRQHGPSPSVARCSGHCTPLSGRDEWHRHAHGSWLPDPQQRPSCPTSIPCCRQVARGRRCIFWSPSFAHSGYLLYFILIPIASPAASAGYCLENTAPLGNDVFVTLANTILHPHQLPTPRSAWLHPSLPPTPFPSARTTQIRTRTTVLEKWTSKSRSGMHAPWNDTV